MFNKFVKEIFNKSGLTDQGFVCKDKEIFLSPIEDFFLGFSFNKSHHHFYIECVIHPIYWNTPYLTLTYGWRLEIDQFHQMFTWDKEKDNSELVPIIIPLLIKAIPKLKSITSPMDFYKQFNDYDKVDKSIDSILHAELMAYTLCYINHSNCDFAINEALERWNKSKYKDVDWVQEIEVRLKKIKDVTIADRKKIFDEWKLNTIKGLRLEKYYNGDIS